MGMELENLIEAVETASSLDALRKALIELGSAATESGENDDIETILQGVDIPTFSYGVAWTWVDDFFSNSDFRIWSYTDKGALVGSCLDANQLKIMNFSDMAKQYLQTLVDAVKSASSLKEVRWALIELSSAYGMAEDEGYVTIPIETLLPVEQIPTFGGHPPLPGNYTEQIWSYSNEQGLIGWCWNEEELKIIDWRDVID